MLNEISDSLNLIIFQTLRNVGVLKIIILVPWLFFFFSHFISNKILFLGIRPRKISGITGIVFAPVLHANFNHLFFNSIPLLVLSDFILINGLRHYIDVTCAITLISGLGIWCFAKPGIHIGASALITGYWSYLIVTIYQNGTVTAFILGLLSIYYFAGIFLGIFPSQKGVSWEGHLFGLLAGISVNWLPIYPA